MNPPKETPPPPPKKLCTCSVYSVLSSDGLETEEGEDQRSQDQTAFLHNVED
ncbi:unnamed protein product [Staurois parvus]|uniref:Uncharacterized protein n=1 Tax=Staurois parvus TaxID=386267 RepID=A0ABN9GC25_9NEOB|nr:unnamed protein product [Staurois parvus]